jgi:hypothetical protein
MQTVLILNVVEAFLKVSVPMQLARRAVARFHFTGLDFFLKLDFLDATYRFE